MKNDSLLFYRIVRDFLTIYLPKQRGASQNTAKSYRDTLNLFIDYISASQGTPLADISFKCISREPVESFLMWLETDRGYSVNSRNQRMCAVKSFLRYAAEKDKILSGLPAETETAGTEGTQSDSVENNMAVVLDSASPYVFCVLSNNIKNSSEAKENTKKISADIYQYMTSESKSPDTPS